jgi:flavorubredoxin
MKRFFRVLAWILGPILFIWLVMTLWVQQGRPVASWSVTPEEVGKRALILYNPDPIYNLDAQLARAFSEGLEKSGWASTVTSYETVSDSVAPRYDLYVIIANTYNWAPDWPTRHFIERTRWLQGSSVVALTLGSGATERSMKLLEEVLNSQGVKLVDSRTFWLLRPNDESRMEESNVKVARDLVREWAENLATGRL